MVKEIVFMKVVNPETISWLIDQCGIEKEVHIRLSSGGGDPIAAIAFFNFIADSGIDLRVTVLSECMSAALIILCAAKVRKAYCTTTFLLHLLKRYYGSEKPFTVKQMKNEIVDLKATEKKLRRIVAKTTGKPRKNLDAYFESEKYLTAQQAFRLGLLTERPL